MNLPKRPGQVPRSSVRVWLSRHAAAAVAAVTLAGFAFGTAPAMTRSSRVHSRPVVVVDQEPVPSHHHRAGHKSATAAPRTNAHNSTTASRGRTSSHTSTREVRTASRHTPSHEDRAKQRTHVVEVASKKSAPHATASRDKAPAKEIAAAKPAPSKSLTSEDFARAAGVTAAPATTTAPRKVYAEGVSRPDEMDDSRPMAPQAASAANTPAAAHLPQVSANNLPAKPTPVAASSRVDGFGAEGVSATPTHRTLARTMAQHRADETTGKEDVPAVFEREDLTEEAVKPVVLPALYTRGGRLIMPQPLRGSHEILVHQNEMATQEGLKRIRDDEELNQMRAAHKLVRLPETASLDVNDDLPVERRYALPWTVRFAMETAKAYSSRFGDPIHVNSAVRTVSYQVRLMRVNGNAADINGETASPHLTGQAIDIGKHGMTEAEIAWMRNYLLPLMQAGKIDVEEEFQQACFHISVYRSYTDAPKKSGKLEVAAR